MYAHPSDKIADLTDAELLEGLDGLKIVRDFAHLAGRAGPRR